MFWFDAAKIYNFRELYIRRRSKVYLLREFQFRSHDIILFVDFGIGTLNSINQRIIKHKQL